MKSLDELQADILQHKALIGVIGLGYVGLPVACMFAKSGFSVIGLEIKPERTEKINKAENPIEGVEPGLSELLQEVVATGKLKATSNYDELNHSDIVLIDVETPVDEHNIPQYVALRAACKSLAQVMREGALVIVESTIAPGTIDRVVRPILEQISGTKSNQGFYLGACPERVMPGKLLINLRKMSRVCGGSTPEVADVMVTLYRNIVEADLDTADPVTAELTKTAENAYRDVNIAFANELAMICESAGADFMRVRELVNKSPGRNVLLAGAGVGGHCIPKDPWLLVYGAQDKATLRLIPAARAVNDAMPLHVAVLLEEALSEVGKSLSEARVAVLGYAYMEDSDDTRNSPTEALVEYLKSAGAQVVIHDPYVPEYQGDVLACLQDCDALALMVAHGEYKSLDVKDMQQALRTPIMIDGRRVFNAQAARQAGFIFRGIGQGR